MAEQFSGSVEVLDSASTNVKITLDGDNADISTGGNGQHGDVILKDSAGNERIRINGQTGNVIVKNAAGNEITRIDGSRGDIILGGNGPNGDIVLKDGAGKERIHLNAGSGRPGPVPWPPHEPATIQLDGDAGNISLGGNGVNGDIVIFPSGGDNKYRNQATIHLDGQTGDIKLSGADCAENFNVLESEQIEPGMVLVVDQEGTLQQSKKAYDKRVVGVVSGARDCRPGIVLNEKHSRDKRAPLALTGKVYCKVDAQHTPIEVGDLLTTSAIPGHAMKANDPLKAFGAVIGKALRPLKKGTGLIPILVALQ